MEPYQEKSFQIDLRQQPNFILQISTTMKYALFLLLILLHACTHQQQEDVVNDFTTPLHLMTPQYNTPYGAPDTLSVIATLERVLNFLDATTPTRLVDKNTGREVSQYSDINENTIVERGTFRLASYEWGVTYAAMLAASESTGNPRYAAYTEQRMRFLAEVAPYFLQLYGQGIVEPQMRQVVHPEALDDAGAMCAALIKSLRLGMNIDGDAMIQRYIHFIMEEEYRLSDGTFARNRPHYNTVWLDDMFMSLPAIAQMGIYSGENKYFDEVIRQILLFDAKMWVPEKQLFRHGWVEDMKDHTSFHWGRANGWTILTLVEVLDALPVNYPGREKILDIYVKHVRGLAKYQSGEGFWHQLLDRNDSYLETSATAIFTYSIARGINKGWIDAMAYGPVATLGWNAVATKVNAAGEVEGTCVGTGMAFDPAFYYYRPVHRNAAHGYGPVLLAGAEMLSMLRNQHPKMNDSGLQFYPHPVTVENPIFWLDPTLEKGAKEVKF